MGFTSKKSAKFKAALLVYRQHLIVYLSTLFTIKDCSVCFATL